MRQRRSRGRDDAQQRLTPEACRRLEIVGTEPQEKVVFAITSPTRTYVGPPHLAGLAFASPFVRCVLGRFGLLDRGMLANRDGEYAYRATTGRATGTEHEIEIWFAGDGPTLWLISGGDDRSDWVRNLLTDQRARVRVGDEQLGLHAGVVGVEERSASHSFDADRVQLVHVHDL